MKCKYLYRYVFTIDYAPNSVKKEGQNFGFQTKNFLENSENSKRYKS